MELASAVETQPLQSAQHPWPLLSRIAFRFCLVYFTLFCIAGQIINSVLIIPKVDMPDWGSLWPVRQLVFWVGAHLFGMKLPMVYSGSGSGDKNYDWAELFCLLVIACVATATWSLLDRKRQSYPILHRWFWLFLRLCLASQMFLYGFDKAFPLQMSFPGLNTLVEPFGDMSPFGVLWTSIGSSPAYEIFAGCAELLAGFLLMFPRTITLGALICLADMTQVFLLNMTYDVPVKIFSFHLILMSLLLLSPEFQRLANFFFLQRAAQPAQRPPLFEGRRARRTASAVIAFLWLWMIGNNIYGAWDGWHKYGPAAPKSALYGIWNIEDSTLDGRPQTLLVTDSQAWRRLIFDHPNHAQVQRMDSSSKGYAAAIDPKTNTLTFTDNGDKNWKASFTFTRSAPDHLTLDGSIAGHKSTLQLKRMDEKKFLLITRGFHWIQDYPYFR